MSVLDQISVNLVDSLDSAQDFMAWLGERRPHIAVDTETTGLAWTDTVRLVQFGDARTGWAVPVEDWRGVAVQALGNLRDAGAPVIFHNSAFDMHKLENDGFPVPLWQNVHDTAVRARLVDSHLRAGLKPVCERLFGKEAVAGADLLKLRMSENKWTWATVPWQEFSYWGYGCLDTCLTALAEDHFRPLTPGPAYEREMAVRAILYRAETRGMRIDPVYTEELRKEWRAEAAVLLRQIQDGGIRNPSSNAQVTQALKEVGWEPEEFTESGAVKLDKGILVGLEGRYGDLAGPLLRYRRLLKWCSTYLDTFLRDRDEDDKVHASINTQGARTGRMSVNAPALQTLPRGPEIRKCVVPDPGHALWSIDYSGMELRMMAHFSKDPGFMDAFRRGEDIHSYCAAMAYGISQDDVPSDKRSTAKNTNFSRIYGAGDAKIAATAGVPVEEIKEYKQGFDARFPGVQQFMDEVQHLGKLRAAQDGFPWVKTTGGRILQSEHDKVYTTVNYLIQGSCADMFKDAIIALDAVGLGDYIIAPIHDEVLFQLPEGPEGQEAVELARGAMEDLVTFRVPFTVDIEGPLSSWGQKYGS